MRKKQKVYDAFFTVEASFIIPIAFLLIMVTIQYGFFCYEKSVSLQCCYIAALRGSNQWDLSGDTLRSYVTGEFRELLNERTLYELDREEQIEVSLTDVTVSFDSYMEVFFAKIRGDNISGWDINNTKKAGRNKPSTYIRRCHMINDSGGGHGGSNQQE